MFVVEVFETGVELDAEGLVSDPDGVENVINIVLDAVFAAVVVGVSVVFDNVDDDDVDSDDVDAVVATVVASVVVVGADDDVVDSAVDDVAAVVAIVVVSVVVAGVDDDEGDSVLNDVGTDVVVVGASVVLGGEDDDVVAVVGTVVMNDVDGGVVSAVEVGGVADVTVDDIVDLFRFPIVQPSVNLQNEQEVSAVFRLFNQESHIFSNHAEHASSLPIWLVKHNLTSDSSHDWR